MKNIYTFLLRELTFFSKFAQRFAIVLSKI